MSNRLQALLVFPALLAFSSAAPLYASGGVANSTAQHNDRAQACSRSIDMAKLQVPPGAEVTNVKCDCDQQSGAVADALGRWSCVGLVSWNKK